MASFTRLLNASLFVGLSLVLVLSLQVSAAETKQYSAQWLVEDVALSERVKNTVWLALISDEAIAANVSTEEIKVKPLFIEAAQAPIYTTRLIEGKRKHVAQFKYDIYPAKPGEFILPKTQITLGRGKTAQVITSSSQQIEITPQPDASRGLIITPKLTLSQKLSATELVAGGAVSREISMEVDNLPGYLIAELPLSLNSDDGDVRVAANGTQTNTFRGATTGKRLTELQYRFSRAGEFTLPEMKVSWWHPTQQVVKYSVIPAIDIVVSPAPPLPFKQRVAIWQAQFSDFLVQHQFALTLLFITLLIVWWQRQLIFKKLGYCYLTALTKLSSPLLVAFLLTVRAAFTSKKAMPNLLNRWLPLIDKPLQSAAKKVSNSIEYQADGTIKLDRAALLTNMCSIVWHQYSQQFSLQPLNPN
ncbi:BatD family protein [Shewanella schlegeliana]|uniref:BatD family protein n=1 Tax=Shewanella schlegeliana TaxID=190308 RepID=A0ABS1T306_9GAMM|nr:BatD family protein [Shewanella schlegeliana]MBL4915177.1 BatD family protein [Shewanella schlegeliana]MCL1110955.1 BatD family protein [Shewanella schlegeliana]GIU29452.1 hypothetical protein TUM4433_18790 [Shewanella schlegeliana]